jgi:hypothetical protein
MHRLSRERAEARGDEQKPGQQLRSVFGRAQELSGLLREIEQDRGGIEDARLPASRPSVSTMAGTLLFGLMARKLGRCCSPLLVSTGIVS